MFSFTIIVEQAHPLIVSRHILDWVLQPFTYVPKVFISVPQPSRWEWILLVWIRYGAHYVAFTLIKTHHNTLLIAEENVQRASTSKHFISDLRRPDWRTPMKVLVKKTFNDVWRVYICWKTTDLRYEGIKSPSISCLLCVMGIGALSLSLPPSLFLPLPTPSKLNYWIMLDCIYFMHNFIVKMSDTDILKYLQACTTICLRISKHDNDYYNSSSEAWIWLKVSISDSRWIEKSATHHLKGSHFYCSCCIYIDHTHLSWCAYTQCTVGGSTHPASPIMSKTYCITRNVMVWTCYSNLPLQNPLTKSVVWLSHKEPGQVAVWTSIRSMKLRRINSVILPQS